MNPKKELTVKELAEVEMMAGLGLRFEDIAAIKDMCLDTLKKYADAELTRGKAKAKLQVAQTAYKMAVSGKTPVMTMFWLKTQARWKEHDTPAPQSVDKPLQQVVQQLTGVLTCLSSGNCDPKVASSMASVANALLKAVTQDELEARLTALEHIRQQPEHWAI